MKIVAALSIILLCFCSYPSSAAGDMADDKKFVEALCYQMFYRRLRQLNPWVQKTEFDSEEMLGHLSKKLEIEKVSPNIQRLYKLCLENAPESSNSAIDLCLDLDIKPYSAAIAKMLMDEHSYGGKRDDAPRLLDTVSKQNYPEFYLLRGMEAVRKSSSFDDLAVAEHFEKTKSLALYCKSLVYNRLGDSKKALDCLEASRVIGSPTSFQLAFEGWIAQKTGEYKKAIDCYKDALKQASPADGLRKRLLGSEIVSCENRLGVLPSPSSALPE